MQQESQRAPTDRHSELCTTVQQCLAGIPSKDVVWVSCASNAYTIERMGIRLRDILNPAMPGISRESSRWRRGAGTTLGALTQTRSIRQPCFSPRPTMSAPVASKDPQAEQAGHGDQREIIRVRRLAGDDEQALNCRCVNPRGDPAGTTGRWTCSAGECSSAP
jgi:hypothetical protein